MYNQTTYPVMEHFHTLQGEGAWAGCAAYFIRLGGCDVGCSWCDVKESWPDEGHAVLTAADLREIVVAAGASRVVLTGGEPLMHDLAPLTHALQGLPIHLETSGVYPLTGRLDWICFSPKKFKAPLPAFYEVAHELKIIVHNRHDLEWAEGHAVRCAAHVQLFLQPDWFRPESAEWIIDYVKTHPKWRLSLQTHKFLNIP